MARASLINEFSHLWIALFETSATICCNGMLEGSFPPLRKQHHWGSSVFEQGHCPLMLDLLIN